MAAVGYVVFTVRAYVRNRPGMIRPLDDLDGNGADVLTHVVQIAKSLAQRPEPATNVVDEQAFGIDRVVALGRHAVIHGESGPYGHPGRTAHIDTGRGRPFDDRTAAMIRLRAMLVVPHDADIGLLLCERLGNRHLKASLDEHVFGPVGRARGVRFEIATCADPAAWSEYLRQAEIREVTYVWRSTRAEDRSPIRRNAGVIKMTAGGGVARRVGGAIVAALRENPQIVEIREEPELTPRADAVERALVEVKVSNYGRERTIVIARDEFPQFVYETERRLTDGAIIELWRAHAEELLSRLGVMPDEGGLDRA